ncbi:DedA family protein [Marinitenerispora sediminis]|uniref:DedA family protein n=1 Tax=Marinitenerispora sediminis TaxID=1931232 RepID=A0A368T4A2_9ACTN|nr:VTT domain-containing protein [Marinitenerispora sediminis]RCV51247.1 DedA family protein [Marinitenerispora sediminis]RCV55775.1 DedA family protein [Marinitenerispora sediminis]RCV57536.1 DedA family protein [Marinitenerispora sediminis]
MPYEFLEGRPFWVVYSALLAIVFCRAQATYWIGRGIGAGVHRSGLARRLGERLTRAERLIDRFGPPAVTLSFLTVGIQTAVNLAAGAMRMSFPRYLVAMFAGCLAWAAVYSLGGMAVLAAWWNLFLHSPLLAVAAAALAVTAVAAAVLWRRRRRRRAGAEPGREDARREETAA